MISTIKLSLAGLLGTGLVAGALLLAGTAGAQVWHQTVLPGLVGDDEQGLVQPFTGMIGDGDGDADDIAALPYLGQETILPGLFPNTLFPINDNRFFTQRVGDDRGLGVRGFAQGVRGGDK